MDNREIASLILIVVFVAYGIRKTGWGSFLDVVRAAAALWQPLLALLMFLGLVYFTVLVGLAAHFYLWYPFMLHDTLIYAVATALPLVFRLVEVRSATDVVRSAILPACEVAAFMSFYINLVSFSIPVEILLQLIVTCLVMLKAFAEKDSKYTVVLNCVNGVFAILGIILLAYSTCVIVTTYDQFEAREVLYLFLMSIWLPVGCFPLFWLFSLVVVLESTFIRLKFCMKDDKGWKKVLILVLLMPSIKAMRYFPGDQYLDLWNTSSAKEIFSVVRDYKRGLSRRVSRERAKNKRYQGGFGKAGCDNDGLRLNRASFLKDKKALEWLGLAQQSSYRRQGSYRSQLKPVFEKDVYEHTIPIFKVDDSGSAWVAWCVDDMGWVFGMGAIGGRDSLYYEGEYQEIKEILSHYSAKESLRYFTSDKKELANWTYDDSIDEGLVM